MLLKTISLRQSMNCIALLLALSLFYGCGDSPASPPGLARGNFRPRTSPSATTISIHPTQAVLTAGNSLQFATSRTGVIDGELSWLVNGVLGGDAASGTISRSGLYTAPDIVGANSQAIIEVRNNVDSLPVSSARVMIMPAPAPINVSVSPTDASLYPGQTQRFTTAETDMVVGSSNASVNWTISGTDCGGPAACGTIDTRGIYTAPTTLAYPTSITVTATSLADPTKSASANVTLTPANTTLYYLATAADGGSDSNNGLSPREPWLTPNHSVNCGNTIIALPSMSYSASNFGSGQWGTVNCPYPASNVAWLKCQTFDGCKINASSAFAQPIMGISNSYWGIEGWEVTSEGTFSSCFAASPPTTNGTNIHHIIFANDIANGCTAGGLVAYNNGTASVDYIAIVGNIAYNTSQGSAFCYSGISVAAPAQTDSLPGTHIYLAGNFSWLNFDPSTCAGGTPTDGEGIILDTWSRFVYTGQAVAENNILFLNGGRGIEINSNTSAPVYFLHNTIYGNNGDTHQNFTFCGDLYIDENTPLVQSSYNIVQTNSATGCGSNTLYALWVSRSTRTVTVANNLAYSAAANNQGRSGNTGFSYGTNVTGTSPNFANPVNPGAPSCGSATSVPNCMATVIDNFTPRASSAGGYGYQIPNSMSLADPLFPQWLCNVNLPPGLVTMGCSSQ
jgi:hypothetical protein